MIVAGREYASTVTGARDDGRTNAGVPGTHGMDGTITSIKRQ